ncbi:hypothetical protein ABW20_dc0105266 [Dactylellina cionopaga]|nr:hypothetical protein ABW20_dc0105266 [Dactylellina cionopaga]
MKPLSCLKKPLLADSVEVQKTNIKLESTMVDTSKRNFKKSVAFARNALVSAVPSSENRERKETGFAENPRTKPSIKGKEREEGSTQRPVISEEIDDLCAWLQRLGIPLGANRQECNPGILTVDKDIQYLIYEEKDTDLSPDLETDPQNYESLLDYLSPGRNVLSIAQRMELAHTLAISLLRLHFSSWINEAGAAKM